MNNISKNVLLKLKYHTLEKFVKTVQADISISVTDRYKVSS